MANFESCESELSKIMVSVDGATDSDQPTYKGITSQSQWISKLPNNSDKNNVSGWNLPWSKSQSTSVYESAM